MYRLVLTPGEPGGVGPDLTITLARRPLPVQLVAAADPGLLTARAAALGVALDVVPWTPDAPRRPHVPGVLPVLAVPLPRPAEAGRADPAHAAYVLDALRRACRGCLQGEFDALVTGPVHKASINAAGIRFTGHTELLAELTGAACPVMLMAAPGLKVALATTHVPLAEVPQRLTRARLEAVLAVLDRDLRRWFGISAARVLVCGLNPHAGEGGHLGAEERDIIGPAIEASRARGARVAGPVPADSAFLPQRLAAADVVLAMYHDQGLPVIKRAAFEDTVNVTLGLPILRTSVDHGTALELAGTGRARDDSLAAAVRLTARLLAAREPGS